MNNRKAAIAIDVGGTKMLAGLVASDGTVLQTRRRATEGTRLLDDLSGLAQEFAEQARAESIDVLGVGVATKGFVDPERRILVRSMSLGVKDLAIGDVVERRTGLPVFVNNDVHACTKGEILFGVGQSHRNFLLFNAGTGVSAGFVLDGRLHVGAGGMAGEVGHMVLSANTAGCCKCGRNGCLEDLLIRAREGEDIDMPDDLRLSALPLPYRVLAIGLANLVNVFNPSAIALVGGMFMNNRAIIRHFPDAVRRLCLASAADSLQEIGLSANGYEAGLIGAGTLPFFAAGRRADTVA